MFLICQSRIFQESWWDIERTKTRSISLQSKGSRKYAWFFIIYGFDQHHRSLEQTPSIDINMYIKNVNKFAGPDLFPLRFNPCQTCRDSEKRTSHQCSTLATVLMTVSSYVRTTLMTYVIFITTMTDRNSTFNCTNQRFLAKLFKKKKYKTNLVISCNAVHSLRLSVR